jgi:hypothetical protein
MSSKNYVSKSKSGGKVKSNRTRFFSATFESKASGGGRPMQTSNKAGVSSSSRKQGSSRNYLQQDPAAGPVAGAFGKTGSLSEVEEEMTHPERDAETQNDFIAKRRRQNKGAKK